MARLHRASVTRDWPRKPVRLATSRAPWKGYGGGSPRLLGVNGVSRVSNPDQRIRTAPLDDEEREARPAKKSAPIRRCSRHGYRGIICTFGDKMFVERETWRRPPCQSAKTVSCAFVEHYQSAKGCYRYWRNHEARMRIEASRGHIALHDTPSRRVCREHCNDICGYAGERPACGTLCGVTLRRIPRSAPPTSRPDSTNSQHAPDPRVYDEKCIAIEPAVAERHEPAHPVNVQPVEHRVCYNPDSREEENLLRARGRGRRIPAPANEPIPRQHKSG